MRLGISRQAAVVAVEAPPVSGVPAQGAVLRHRGPARASLDWGQLGPRQLAVAEGVLAGETNGQISARLDMSVHTVREHLKRMAGRLNARGRAGLIAGLWEARLRHEGPGPTVGLESAG